MVADGRAAVALVARRNFDLILMDIQVPELDGYEATAAIRAMERATGSTSLPAIALTGYAGVEDRERALSAGFNAHVPKPIEPDALASAVAAVLTQSAGARARRV